MTVEAPDASCLSVADRGAAAAGALGLALVSACRRSAGREADTGVAGARSAAGGVAGGVRAGGAAAAGGSAERVTVPCRLKPSSSRGPTASVAGAFVVASASWASAGAGVSASPATQNATPKRKTALILSRFCS